jgi:threonine aldolase
MSTLIDLVSDTATRPTQAMRSAMVNALVGDEQKGEDPSVTALETTVAQITGMERALLLPSATMANQIALMLLTSPGDEVLCHENAHIVHYEAGGVSLHARAQLRLLQGGRGQFNGDTVRKAMRTNDPHHPQSAALVIENTSNGGGGSVWPLTKLDDVYTTAHALGLKVHIDGARLWHAAASLQVPMSRLLHGATTVQLCFSKAMGCPFGAVLAMPAALWPKARRWKQAFGGCGRQMGMIAAAMTHAIEHHAPLLHHDHRRAQVLAEALRKLPGMQVEAVDTNLVFFTPPTDSASWLARLRGHNVRMGQVAGSARIRAALHYDIDDEALSKVVHAVSAVHADT